MTEWKAGDRAMTAAEAALIEGCIRLRHTIAYDRSDMPGQPGLADLAAAVLAERAPPDPVEVAWHAYNKASSFMRYGPVPEWFRANLKAYDEAKGEKS